jgi:hypothetical protein
LTVGYEIHCIQAAVMEVRRGGRREREREERERKRGRGRDYLQ